MSGAVWIGICILLSAVILEIFIPNRVKEGFEALNYSDPDPPLNILTSVLSRRNDIGVGRENTVDGLIQDPRYFAGYANIQRLGVKNDFCRMVTKSGKGDTEELFFACGLGTLNNSSSPTPTKGTGEYRTNNVRDGFVISRDDYMRDVFKEGRDSYCRIILKDGVYQPMCRRSMDFRFSDRDEMDTDPPEEIKTLSDFYSGCELWLRLRDDMVDYVNRAVVQTTGGLIIDQTPNPTVTRGLSFNGKDQFVRLGDSRELSLGNRVKMRMIRAFSVWVKFTKFTNNAHIFDFGDGAGNNNVFLGILGKGDGEEAIRPDSTCPETTIPDKDKPSGAQFCPEVRPQTLYESSAADVEHWECKNPSVLAKKIAPIQTRPIAGGGGGSRATLLYEVWDKRLRKVQIKINRAIPIDQWTHILVTAKNMDAMRPTLNVVINGNIVFSQEAAFLPQAKITSNNYLGKSNWANDFSDYELRDELFQGNMFDFRMYSSPVSESKGKRILQWGMRKLGLDNSYASSV